MLRPIPPDLSTTNVGRRESSIGREGFGAFSYSHSQLGGVIKYINDQEQHHTKMSFREEYLELLERFNVEFENKYVFEWI